MALGLNDFDRVNPILWPLEGVGPENLNTFGPKWHSLYSLPKKFPSNGPQNGFAPQNHCVPRHINNTYIICYSL
jgi:hypothetical protein